VASLANNIAILDETKSFNKSLVDAEGFPRSDIDFGELSNYRNLKRKFAELNNDHLALMK
jgi:26S proteasome non-ATPase regulatory subunit 9